MTNPTPQDREMADKAFDIAFAGDTNGIDEAMSALFTTARLQGRKEGLEEAARALEADAQLCDCHAHDEGECACGAWCEWKTVPMHRAVEIVRALAITQDKAA